MHAEIPNDLGYLSGSFNSEPHRDYSWIKCEVCLYSDFPEPTSHGYFL